MRAQAKGQCAAVSGMLVLWQEARLPKTRVLARYAASVVSPTTSSKMPQRERAHSAPSDGRPGTRRALFPVANGNLDDSQLVTLRLESGCHIRFQVDTGAQCNVVPLGIYKKATKDTQLKQVTPSHHSLWRHAIASTGHSHTSRLAR